MLWAQETGTSDHDVGYGVSVTGDGGIIYVTGYSSDSLNGQLYAGGRLCLLSFIFVYIRFGKGGSDIVLLKFDAFGSLLWTRETGTSGDDYGYGVSVTPDGSSIYVTGYSYGTLNGQPYAG